MTFGKYATISTLDIWGFIDWAHDEIEREVRESFSSDTRVMKMPEAAATYYWGMRRSLKMLSEHLAEVESEISDEQAKAKKDGSDYD